MNQEWLDILLLITKYFPNNSYRDTTVYSWLSGVTKEHWDTSARC